MKQDVIGRSSQSHTPIWCCGLLPVRQGGAVSLVVVLVLLIALTLIVLAMGRVGVQEQIISGNDQRSDKAIAAAQAGIEHGMAWLAENFVGASSTTWADGTTATWPVSTTVPNNVTPGSGEAYTVQVNICRWYSDAKCDGESPTGSLTPYLRVRATATDANDASVTAIVQQFAARTSSATAASGGAPPLVINGCFDKNNGPGGTPDIVPCTSTGTPYEGEAILANEAALTYSDCGVAEGSGDDPQAMCTCPSTGKPTPNLNLNGGDVETTLSSTDIEENPPGDGYPNAAWERIFPNMTREEFKNRANGERLSMLAGTTTLSQRSYIYMDSADPRADNPSHWGFNTNHWAMDVGTGNTNDIGTIHQVHSPCGTIEPRIAEHPVVLYFGNGGSGSSDCPKINANVTIWGVVYYENCTDDGNGLGGGTLFGTMGIESTVDTINSNVALCCTADGTGGAASDDKLYTTLVRVPGTWSEL